MKEKLINRQTHRIDASSLPLGRLATKIADLLRGKGKPLFQRNLDCGDFVIVENAKNLKVTGKKFKQKIYYHYSGYLGGMKESTLAMLFKKDPVKIIFLAVKNMLPKNRLRKNFLKRLKIYPYKAD